MSNCCLADSGAQTVPILEQIRHVEFWDPAVGDLLVRTGALPSNSPGRRGEARGEGIPDGGSRGLPRPGLHHHEGREC